MQHKAIQDHILEDGAAWMRRGWMTYAKKGGRSLTIIVMVDKRCMKIVEVRGWRRVTLKVLVSPEVEIIEKRGNKRNWFRSGYRPAWWIEITDADGSRWPMRCRNLGDATSIKKWADKRQKLL